MPVSTQPRLASTVTARPFAIVPLVPTAAPAVALAALSSALVSSARVSWPSPF